MSKGYKQEYIQKVKAKFNDVQSNRGQNTNTSGKSSNDKRSEIQQSSRVVVQR